MVGLKTVLVQRTHVATSHLFSLFILILIQGFLFNPRKVKLSAADLNTTNQI